MLLDLVISCVARFQEDCSHLCAKHYPTVHNQGMSEHHLGLAFAKRMHHTLLSAGHASTVEPLELLCTSALPHHYRVSSELGTIWILSHHFISATKHCREKLLDDIAHWQKQYQNVIAPNDLLFLLSDHWINRSKSSRELLHWWQGELPKEQAAYQAQGITLYESPALFVEQVKTRFAIDPCYLEFAHPLKRNGQEQAVKKYLQLYGILEC